MHEKPAAPGVRFIDLKPPQDDLLAQVRAGLRAEPKYLPPKLFYDETGSKLFEQICAVEDYYPTRTELGILKSIAQEVSELVGPRVQIVEFGAGALEKIGTLLDRLEDPAGFVALDISGEHLVAAAQDCAARYPDLDIVAIAADYSLPFDIPDPQNGAAARRLGFFPGSTIGNMVPDDARAFLANAAQVIGPGGAFLLGADLIKDKAILERAYNDREGVTAAFNLNMLSHLNRALGADFDLDGFEHLAFYNEDAARIEMHLLSRQDQSVTIAGERYSFAEGERLSTEYSHKYTLEGIAALGEDGGFAYEKQWTDPDGLFSVTLFRVPAD